MFDAKHIYGHVEVLTKDFGARVAIELAAFAGGVALKQDDHDDRFRMELVFGLSFTIEGGEGESGERVSIDVSSQWKSIDTANPHKSGPFVDVSTELVCLLKKHEYFGRLEVLTLVEWQARFLP